MAPPTGMVSMIRREPHVYAGNPLDRASELRKDPATLERLARADNARFLPVWQLKVLVSGAQRAALAWQPADGLPAGCGPSADELVFLGLDDGIPHFAIGIAGDSDPAVDGGFGGATFEEVRGLALAARLSPDDIAISAQARSLVGWHARHRHCAACGAPTRVVDGGYRRSCTRESCGASHFPRTDPVVIMMAVQDDRALLGRQSFWTPGMYSTLAGFMEPGETIEEAVRREVYEETAIVVGDVMYHSSQPWPFPSSLMIGCIGKAESVDLVVDTREVEAAGWYSRDEVRAGLARAANPPKDGTFHLPFPASIAHQLARWWVDNG
jgi:NAD+ diphosphatase